MNNQTIIVRPSRSNAWSGLIFLSLPAIALAVFFFCNGKALRTSDAEICIALLSLIMVIPILLLVWTYANEVRSEGGGLRWRTLRGTKYASWSQVRDYYEKNGTGRDGRRMSHVIETVVGKFSIPKAWSGDQASFRAAVQRHATAARTTSWQQFGDRPALDWPREFRYRPEDLRTTRILTVVAFCVGLPYFFVVPWSHLLFALREPDGSYTAIMLLLTLVRMMLPSLLGFVLLSQLRDRLRRKNERIVVSLEGICANSVASEVQLTKIAWEQVRRCSIQPSQQKGLNAPSRYVVEGAGSSIEFTVAISEFTLLTDILPRHSTNLDEKAWKIAPALSDTLDHSALWTGGYEGVGERRFHYRTRTIRAFLWYATALALSTLLRPILTLTGLVDNVRLDAASLAPTPLICAAIIGWLWWRYYAAAIIVNADGITCRAPFRHVTLRWRDVATYGLVGGDAFTYGEVTDTSGKRIHFWIGIAEGDTLKNEISTRSTNAIGNWSKKEA